MTDIKLIALKLSLKSTIISFAVLSNAFLKLSVSSFSNVLKNLPDLFIAVPNPNNNKNVLNELYNKPNNA